MRIFYLLVAMLMAGCGVLPEHQVVEKPYPVFPPGCDENGCEEVEPPPPGGGGLGSTTYAEMQEILNDSCRRCHATADFSNTRSEAELRRLTKVNARVSNGSMPPPGSPEDNAFSLENERAIKNFFQ
jgi:hypothetical protein